jgi:hypothetical protein
MPSLPSTTSLGTFDIELSEMQPTDDGRGQQRVVIGKRVGDIVVEIDREKFKKYARRALSNNTRKCVALGGAVVFRVAKNTEREIRNKT